MNVFVKKSLTLLVFALTVVVPFFASEEAQDNLVLLEVQEKYESIPAICRPPVNKDQEKNTGIAPHLEDIACLVTGKRDLIWVLRSDIEPLLKRDLMPLIRSGKIKIRADVSGPVPRAILYHPKAEHRALLLNIVNFTTKLSPYARHYLIGKLLGYADEDITFFLQHLMDIEGTRSSRQYLSEDEDRRLEQLFNKIPEKEWIETDHVIFDTFLKESHAAKKITEAKEAATQWLAAYNGLTDDQLKHNLDMLNKHKIFSRE